MPLKYNHQGGQNSCISVCDKTPISQFLHELRSLNFDGCQLANKHGLITNQETCVGCWKTKELKVFLNERSRSTGREQVSMLALKTFYLNLSSRHRLLGCSFRTRSEATSIFCCALNNYIFQCSEVNILNLKIRVSFLNQISLIM